MLDQVIRRCLAPLPDERYSSGAELARALEGCRELRRIERELPPPGPLTRAALQRPFLCMLILMLLPHILGSIVNISYNALEIVGKLNPEQKTAFNRLVLGYNLIAYPLCLGIIARLVIPVYRAWQRLQRGEPLDPAAAERVRKRVLAWPLWVVAVSCLGWIPGGVLFPLGIHLLAGPLPMETFGHFLVSFTISGLIALTYSFFAVQFIVLRVLYPRFCTDPANVRATITSEVSSIGTRVRWFQVLAGVIPLAGAVLMVGVGDDVSSDPTFRLLVTALIILGMAGFFLSVTVHSLLSRTLAALTVADTNPKLI